MKVFKQLFDFYINSSIHVALSCYALVRVTHFIFQISEVKPVANFAFFGTIVGYNFVKYDALARTKKGKMRYQLKAIVFLSFCSFGMVGCLFFELERMTQIVSIVFMGLTLLYALPFFSNKKNARSCAGVKIYIVSFCWVGVTVFLPVLNARIPIEGIFFVVAFQRFILIFVLILLFEIIDLDQDDLHLQTVPQQIGVALTKRLGYFMLGLFCVLEFFNFNGNIQYLVLSLLFIFAIAVFLAFSNQKRSKYYTSFWVESLPIFWWILIFFCIIF